MQGILQVFRWNRRRRMARTENSQTEAGRRDPPDNPDNHRMIFLAKTQLALGSQVTDFSTRRQINRKSQKLVDPKDQKDRSPSFPALKDDP